MNWLIINSDYPAFLTSMYDGNPGLASASFAEQQAKRFESLFGLADSFPRALKHLGHNAMEVFINNEPMQRRWCIEHNVCLPRSSKHQFRMRRGVLPWLSSSQSNDWQLAALKAQVEITRPDVVLNRNMYLDTNVLSFLKQHSGILIGQHAATRLPYSTDYSLYDIVVSSFPATIQWFRRRNIEARYGKLGFDPHVLDVVKPPEKVYPLTFVGSLMPVHSTRLELLEAVCEVFDDFRFWTSDIAQVPADSPLQDRYMGSVWGAEMYRILAMSDVTINEHGAVAPYANNYRLYEATGMGSCLLTDCKQNLDELFEPGVEVETYTSSHECLQKIEELLSDPDRRTEIASTGQRRTLNEHTIPQRVQEILSWL